MSEVLDKKLCLQLNNYYAPIGVKTVKDGIKMMCSERPVKTDDGTKTVRPANAINLEYAKNNDGSWNFKEVVNFEICDWEKWITLPIRDFDYYIKCGAFIQEVRVPTILVAKNYDGNPNRSWRFSRKNVMDRDGKICQYSGKYAPNGNVDHVLPISRGGPNTFENTVWCSREINLKKDNRTPKEAGLKLIRQPAKPKEVKVGDLIQNRFDIPDWNYFLKKKK